MLLFQSLHCRFFAGDPSRFEGVTKCVPCLRVRMDLGRPTNPSGRAIEVRHTGRDDFIADAHGVGDRIVRDSRQSHGQHVVASLAAYSSSIRSQPATSTDDAVRNHVFTTMIPIPSGPISRTSSGSSGTSGQLFGLSRITLRIN